MRRFSQHPDPDYTVIHLSDLHFLAGHKKLLGCVNTDRTLSAVVERVRAQLPRADAIVVTGDLADRGEPEAYDRAASLLDPLASTLGAELVWVMGNHDERPAFASRLYGESGIQPQYRLFSIGSLRIIALDSTVPGYHHGALDTEQLEWLTQVLATPAPAGTILALHHPPLPSPVEVMGLIELRNLDDLRDAISGSDVRAILAGHLHHTSFGTFAGVPVSVAGATCYTIDALAAQQSMKGVNAEQNFSLVEVFADSVVHSTISPFAPEPVITYTPEFIGALKAMTPEERDLNFSRKG